ncbi:hypothetical protein L6E03_18300 [Enterobacter kobei]|uniref:hypothetical protein n=1 Tax=Enterobacter kobei TaxID=208224 RepID=UPI002350AE30|nr:hypothetical protein [Enterobacter kobei]MDC7948945.1 hypothetical protein [Enterobacter kobei]
MSKENKTLIEQIESEIRLCFLGYLHPDMPREIAEQAASDMATEAIGRIIEHGASVGLSEVESMRHLLLSMKRAGNVATLGKTIH